MKTTRHDIIYNDGTYVMYMRGGQNIWKKGEGGVAHYTLWVKFPNLGIFSYHSCDIYSVINSTERGHILNAITL